MFVTSYYEKQWCIGKTIEGNKANATVSISEEKQAIRGFGGCFNELGYEALKTLSDDKKDELINEFFSKDGCNFNFCRVPIGASDYALEWYSCNDCDGDYEMKNFSVDRDKKYLIPYIKRAMKIRPDLSLFASPWSPPTWMKYPKTNNGGQLIDNVENMKAYALYLKKFVEEYKKEGINIAQIHVQNEPCSYQLFPSCLWNGETFRKFIGCYLSKELDGIADIFLGTINGPETDGRMFHTRYKDLAGYILQDENCRKAVKGVSYQWAGKYAIQQTHDDYPDLELIQSESECGNGDNSWQAALYIFEMMRHYFRNGVSSYIYWNMILGETGLSTWGWNQNSMVNIKDGQIVYNPEFYAMKHLSSFVKKGARYLELKGNWSSNCIGFKNPDGQIVIAISNPYDEEKTVATEGVNYILPSKSISTIVI